MNLSDPSLDFDELFPMIFNISSNLLSITRVADNCILRVNPAWLNAFGYQASEVVGKTSQELNLWVDQAQRQCLKNVIETDGEHDQFEALFQGKDGRRRHCLVTARAFDNKGVECYLFSSEDITADKQAEKTVLASRAILADAIESINEGFVLYDASHRLIVCNSKFREFYGYSKSETAPGVSAIELGRLDVQRGAVLLPPEASGEEYSLRRENLGAGLSKFMVVQLRDGRHLLLSDRQTDSGGIVSIQTDISELKHAEKELSRLRDEAVAANHAKSEFLAHMSHELRTPLNSILGFTQVMREQLFGPLGHEKYVGYVELVLQSGEHLLSLINDVLDLSKVEAGELGLDEKPFELNKTLAACVQMITGRETTGICSLWLEDRGKLPFFLGDERLMTQILLNLLSNAVKFTHPDGEVVVRADYGDSQGWRVTVTDTGCGLSSEDIPKVLEPFGQVRTGSLQSHEGTGLGLSLSKKLTELHGGQLEIESTLGAGTKVTLWFPKDRALKVAQVDG